MNHTTRTTTRLASLMPNSETQPQIPQIRRTKPWMDTGGYGCSSSFRTVFIRVYQWFIPVHNLRNLCNLWMLLFAVAFTPLQLTAQTRTIGLFLDDSAAAPGYTLFAPMQYTTTYLIDDSGMLCHSWPSRWMPGRSVVLLENGDLLHSCFMAPAPNPHFPGGGEGGRTEEYDWDGNQVWAYNYSDSMHLQHHEVKPLPNGNFLMIAYDRFLHDQAIAAGRDPGRIAENEVWPDHVIEVQKTGETTGTIVWEWHAWDHLIQDYDSTKANYGNVAAHPELIDFNFGPAQACWNHTNSINYNADLDQILLSVRGNSEIWVIDHSTTTEQARGHTGGNGGKGGDLLYRWGNPQAYRAGTGSNEKLFQQHDAAWIPADCPGANHILIFNNGQGRGYTTIDEIVPPVDSLGHYYLPPGGHYGPEAACWTYIASPPNSFYSSEISGAQREPNGNTLTDDGCHGVFFEIAPDTSMVWKYVNPVQDSGPMYQGDTARSDPHRADQKMNAVFKIHRYAPDYPAFNGRSLTPQGPIERYNTGVAHEPGLALLAPKPLLLWNPRGILTFTNLPTSGTVELFTVTGRRTRRQPFSRPGERLTWDVSAIGPGAYLSVVRGATGSVLTSGKIIVVH
jgi:hypothetical protein